MIAFPPKDTILLDLPVETHYCSDGGSLLLESLDPAGNGVLLRLRYGDSLTSDSFPIVQATDLGAVPAAVVAIRYLVHDAARGYTLDSGSVVVRRQRNTLEARGAGVGVGNAIRVPARLEYHDVPIGADTSPCNYQP